MSSLWLMVVSFCRIYWLWGQAKGERNISLAWNESRMYCEGTGKALFDLRENKSNIILRDILNDTNQTWVAATVELSHFVKQPVCMGARGLSFIVNRKFEVDIISNCLKYCRSYRYAGVKDRDCYCFKDASNLNRSMVCNFTCYNDPVHVCGGNESISLYEKVDTVITQKIAAGSKECVYARNTAGSTDLFTASCLCDTADGGMCEGGRAKECKDHNWTFFDNKICRMDLPFRFRWIHTMKLCADIGGQLLSSNIPSLKMKENSSYWIGFHRIATIHEAEGNDVDLQFNVNDTSCAVARKDGDILVIEGEDCHAKHAIVCQDKDNPESRVSMSTQPNEKTKQDGMISYVVAAVSAILVVVIGIIAFSCAISRRQKRSRHAKVSVTNSSGDQHILLEWQSTNPPTKPSRKAHSKKDHARSSYENIVLVRSEQSVTMQHRGHALSPIETFDRIDLDKVHGESKDNTEEDLHVYDHTSLLMTEDQYDQTVLSGDKSLILEETYDRTTLRQQLDMTNSTHVREPKVDSETGKRAENDYDSTHGQN